MELLRAEEGGAVEDSLGEEREVVDGEGGE